MMVTSNQVSISYCCGDGEEDSKVRTIVAGAWTVAILFVVQASYECFY